MRFVVELVDVEVVESISNFTAFYQINKAEVTKRRKNITSVAELRASPFVRGMDRYRPGLVDLDMYSQSEYFGHHHFGH